MPKRPLQVVLIIAIFIPILIYLKVWDYYAINIPKWDDHGLKQFLVDYLHATTWSEKWVALSKQHNEHRILMTRLFALWDYTIYEQLNFRHLQFIGNLLFLLVIILWSRLLKHNNKPLVALLPIAFIWPTLAHWENLYWGMAAIQNFGVVTLVLLAIYWSLKNDWGYLTLGLLTGGLAAFSSGNGLLVLPIIVLLQVLSKDYKKAVIALSASIIFIISYFSDFHKVDYNPTSFAGFWLTLKGFFVFIGSFAQILPFKNGEQISMLFGVVLFLVSATIILNTTLRLWKNEHTEDQVARLTDTFCLGVLLFALGTTLVVVWGRTGFGMETLLTSRYKIYSFVFLITIYLYIVIPIRGNFFHPYVTGITFLCLIYNVFAYHYNLVEAHNLRKYLTTSQFNQLYQDKHLNAFSDTSFVASLVEKPTLFYEKWLPLLPTLEQDKQVGDIKELKEIIQHSTVNLNGNSLLIKNENFKNQRLQDSGIYILLTSEDRYYLYPTYRTRNTGRKDLILRQQYFAPDFYSDIPLGNEGDPTAGTYKISYIYQKGDHLSMIQELKTLEIPKVQSKDQIKTNW